MISKIEISKIVEEALVHYITDKVIEKICNMKKSALVLFSGAAIGFNESIESLKKLKSDGWKLTVVLSKGAENALTADLIKTLLGLDFVITENPNENFMQLVDKNNLILMPTLTINSASKIANCISDNLITNIVSHSLMGGKTIIAANDGCDPENETRKSLGFNVTESYKKALKNNLDILTHYGIKLTTADNLAETANLFFKKSFIKEVKKDKESCIDENTEDKIIFVKDSVISRGCIINNSNFSVIKVYKNAVITDLAREEAAKLNIKLIKN